MNGKKTGEGRIAKTGPMVYSTDDIFDVGEDWGAPVAASYKLPFKFTGSLKRVMPEVK